MALVVLHLVAFLARCDCGQGGNDKWFPFSCGYTCQTLCLNSDDSGSSSSSLNQNLVVYEGSVAPVMPGSQNYRITEYAQLEGTHKGHQVQILAVHGATPKSHALCLRALSMRLSSSVRLDALTTSLRSLFQCPNTLSVKNLFLISNLSLP